MKGKLKLGVDDQMHVKYKYTYLLLYGQGYFTVN